MARRDGQTETHTYPHTDTHTERQIDSEAKRQAAVVKGPWRAVRFVFTRFALVMSEGGKLTVCSRNKSTSVPGAVAVVIASVSLWPCKRLARQAQRSRQEIAGRHRSTAQTWTHQLRTMGLRNSVWLNNLLLFSATSIRLRFPRPDLPPLTVSSLSCGRALFFWSCFVAGSLGVRAPFYVAER